MPTLMPSKPNSLLLLTCASLTGPQYKNQLYTNLKQNVHNLF